MERTFTNISRILLSITLAVIIIGCGMSQMQSRWRDRDIVIDGLDEGPEWEYARYFIDKQQVTLGIMNDNEAVYLRLSSRDIAVQSTVLTGGLTIWFSEKDAVERTFGIRYPTGISENDTTYIPPMPQAAQVMGMRRGGRSGAIETSAIESAINGMMKAAGDELEIVDAKNVVARLNRTEAAGSGIEYALAWSAGNLVYELRVPLRRGDTGGFGIASSNPDYITIGFETGRPPENQLAASVERQRDDDASDRMNPDDPDYDDGMLIYPTRRRESDNLRTTPYIPPQTREVDMWLKIQLAEKPVP